MIGLVITEIGQYMAIGIAGYCLKKGHYKAAAIASAGVVALEVTQYYIAGKTLKRAMQVNKYQPKTTHEKQTTNKKERKK